MVVQNMQVELLRPPVPVAPTSIGRVYDWALALAIGDSHVFPFVSLQLGRGVPAQIRSLAQI
jgi:hypothetical protein